MQLSQTMLRDFVARVMDREGAVVELTGPEILNFIAPEPLQQRLGIAEFGQLGFSGDLADGVHRVSFESDWIERLGSVLGERGRVLKLALDVPAPAPSHPERMLEHALSLHNAVCRPGGFSPEWTRYMLLTFRYSAVSDEKRDGLVKLGFNLVTGSAIDEFFDVMIGRAMEAGKQIESAPGWIKSPPAWPPERLSQVLERSLPHKIHFAMARFLASVDRRLDRDLARLKDYYNDLREQAIAPGRSQSGDIDKRRMRVDSIVREYQTKVADLAQKYAVNINVEWIQALELVMPVQRLKVLIKRRKGEREISLDWNPLMKRLEPAPCEFRFTSTAGRVVCDDSLHLVSPEAMAPCGECHKGFCRVCHPMKCAGCGFRAGS
jgi:hypothetical protein